uniref:DUF4238 domain-containing protein n=1 Tax=uncultured Sphingomonas sp. TaxID=158754 RepID=UPI0035CAFB11
MPKKHHYVPVTYLRRFVDASGQLLVYRKDEPTRPFRQRPESTGFETHYYSQTGDDGVRDDSSLEALFSEIESSWPSIVDALSDRQNMFASAPSIITFLALMRVRGPAFRDAAERHLSNVVHLQTQVLHDAGKLPPPPEGYEDLFKKMQVAIDPHQSLLAMAESLNTIGGLFGSLSYDVLHNETATPFLTSDNPVMYYDPKIPERLRLPYTIRPPHGAIELLFPVTPSMVLRGRSSPRRKEIAHKVVRELRAISRINRLTSRFAYRTVFASEPGLESVIEDNAEVSPIPQFDRLPAPNGGYYAFGQFIFGTRPDKPKW